MWYNAYTLMQKVGSVRKPMLSLSVSEAVAVASVAAVFACCPVRAAAADEAAFADEGELTPLVVAKGELRPFAEQHDICAFAVPWFDSAGRDLVCEGSCFGSRPLIYRFLRIERGAPVYADGVPYDGPSPRNAAPWHGVDGSFSLCRVEKGAEPHEESGIGREEMPNPGHEFCRIGWCISPITTIAVSLTGMVHNHQDGQANLQIIEII